MELCRTTDKKKYVSTEYTLDEKHKLSGDQKKGYFIMNIISAAEQVINSSCVSHKRMHNTQIKSMIKSILKHIRRTFRLYPS